MKQRQLQTGKMAADPDDLVGRGAPDGLTATGNGHKR